jgi:cobalt-zinc-cadmium efflux system outer membrane protein
MRILVRVCSLVVLFAAPARAAPASDGRHAELDRLLANEARLDWMIELARLQNPALRASHAEVAAASAGVSAAAGLPDLELKYEQWGVPLNRPYALNRADTVMLGVRQAFPAPGVVGARERLAKMDAALVADEASELERELLLRLRLAYAAYYESERALEVQGEHVELVERMVAQLHTDYEIGRATQQDVLQMGVELSRLHNEIAELRLQRASSRVLLNTLAARDPGAALGPPPPAPAAPPAPDLKSLTAQADERRPELTAARHQIERSALSVELARYSARRPAFMVGADYWYMPLADTQHAYGAMLSMSLPWLNPRNRAAVRAAELGLAAERGKLEAASQKARYELHDAAARLEAVSESLRIIEQELLPQAERSLETARAMFGVGRGNLFTLLDTLRAYFGVRLQHARAQARVSSARAELELAAGVTSEPSAPERGAPP